MSASSELKIIWLSPSYGYNGNFMYFYQIFKGFCEYFNNTKIAVDKNFDLDRYGDLPLWPILENLSFNYSRVQDGKKYETTTKIPSLHTFMEMLRADFDVLITIEFTPLAVLGMIAARVRGKKIILLIETDAAFRFSPKNKFNKFFKSFLARLPTKIMTCNDFGRKYVNNVLGVDDGRVTVKPYLTSDPKFYEKINDEKGGGFCRIDGKINILYFNSVNERKGIEKLLNAFVLLDKESGSNLYFHIVGGGDKLSSCKEFVKNNGLSDNFQFYGKVDYEDAWKYYRSVDVFISSTLADYRSLGGFEAINMGLPVIVSCRDGAYLEVCRDGANGWVFDPLDEKDFIRVLNDLMIGKDGLIEKGAVSSLMAENLSGRAIVNNLISEVIAV